MCKKWICEEKRVERASTRGIGVGPKGYWRPGQIITASFVEGAEIVHEFVRSTVEDHWGKWINLRFEWLSPDYNTMLRIGFDRDRGSWSYVGNDALLISARGEHGDVTINFGWLDILLADNKQQEAGGLVLHEFGHVLGMSHEQNHPENTIPWDRGKVQRDYVETGLMTMKSFELLYGHKAEPELPQTPYDRRSIMHYWLDPGMLVDGLADEEIVGTNWHLSEGDMRWAFLTYPPTAPSPH